MRVMIRQATMETKTKELLSLNSKKPRKKLAKYFKFKKIICNNKKIKTEFRLILIRPYPKKPLPKIQIFHRKSNKKKKK